ncbi:hypothetical protein AGMMS49992_33590 [Clostridia bacterium]|nr:hypothetical protein AGMMS49992_33590 [Clostridia bacterium]
MFGFHFLENFDYPYISKSVTEFWRRWHMSLGHWFRDYVYFPLGGSRVKTKGRLVLNLFVVWLLTGIWHGASWNFIIWGLFYFVLLVIEKLTGIPKRFKRGWLKAAYRAFTLLCVMFGWVLFRAVGLDGFVGYTRSMFGLSGNVLTDANVIFAIREYWLFLLFAILCSTTLFRFLQAKVNELSKNVFTHAVANVTSIIVTMFLFIYSISFLIIGGHNPFIYFNF